MATTSPPLRCSVCGEPQHTNPDPSERLVRDNADGRIYCAFCADQTCRVVHGAPAIIRHQDGSRFSFRGAR